MAKTDVFQFRCSPEEKAKWDEAARVAGVSTAELIRMALDGFGQPTSIRETRTKPDVMTSPDRLITKNLKVKKGALVVKKQAEPFSAVVRKPHHPTCTCLICNPMKK